MNKNNVKRHLKIVVALLYLAAVLVFLFGGFTDSWPSWAVVLSALTCAAVGYRLLAVLGTKFTFPAPSSRFFTWRGLRDVFISAAFFLGMVILLLILTPRVPNTYLGVVLLFTPALILMGFGLYFLSKALWGQKK